MKRREYKKCVDCGLNRVVVINDWGIDASVRGGLPQLTWAEHCTACQHLQRAKRLEYEARVHRAKAHVIFEARKARATKHGTVYRKESGDGVK